MAAPSNSASARRPFVVLALPLSDGRVNIGVTYFDGQTQAVKIDLRERSICASNALGQGTIEVARMVSGREDTDSVTVTVMASRGHNPNARLRRRASAPEQIGRESSITLPHGGIQGSGHEAAVRETAQQTRPSEGASAQERASEVVPVVARESETAQPAPEASEDDKSSKRKRTRK